MRKNRGERIHFPLFGYKKEMREKKCEDKWVLWVTPILCFSTFLPNLQNYSYVNIENF